VHMGGWVYIMASKRYGTIYVGVTSDLPRRVWEHKNDILPGFTSRYMVHNSFGTNGMTASSGRSGASTT
jgi:predicted GIY-YIG superfamily endonuclease